MSQTARVLRSLAFLAFTGWAFPLAAQPAAQPIAQPAAQPIAQPSAAPVEEAVRFHYAAPPECPDVRVFADRVHERTARGRPAEPGELARTFELQIAPDSSGFTGSIAFLDDGGAKVERKLHGEQCDAVVSSLALITALALDATLRAEDESSPAPPTPPPVVEPTRSAPTRTPPRPPQRRTPSRRKLPAFSGGRLGAAVAASTALHSEQVGVAPQLALLAQLDWRSGWALRLSAHVDWRELTIDDGRQASLRLLGVETSLCPWRFGFVGGSFAPCASFDFGSLLARGQLGDGLTHPSVATIVWAALGAEARLAVEPPGSPFWAELRAGLALPLVSGHRFQFRNPTALVYEVPVATGLAGAVAGVRFW